MAELINIKNKSTYSGKGEYIGRGSPLGNPFKITEVMLRHMVIDTYAVWLRDHIITEEDIILAELNRLFNILLCEQKLILICHCSPKPCHGNIIKQVLENKFYTGKYLVDNKI